MVSITPLSCEPKKILDMFIICRNKLEDFMDIIMLQSDPAHPYHLIAVNSESDDSDPPEIILRNFQFWLRSKHILLIYFLVEG